MTAITHYLGCVLGCFFSLDGFCLLFWLWFVLLYGTTLLDSWVASVEYVDVGQVVEVFWVHSY